MLKIKTHFFESLSFHFVEQMNLKIILPLVPALWIFEDAVHL